MNQRQVVHPVDLNFSAEPQSFDQAHERGHNESRVFFLSDSRRPREEDALYPLSQVAGYYPENYHMPIGEFEKQEIHLVQI